MAHVGIWRNESTSDVSLPWRLKNSSSADANARSALRI